MKAKLDIHSENILPIIKRWLYSDKEIFVRELISNSCDALRKRKILADQGQFSLEEEALRIDVTLDKEKKTIVFADTGIGMDADEVQRYIAQIAFSGAEDFVHRYQAHAQDQLIGHFGLGFYSAYMVADKVTLDSLSCKSGAEPVLWECDGSSEYTLQKGSRKECGTEITLFVGKESEEFLELSSLRVIMQRYCSFLPYPIYLNGERINTQEPLWVKPPSECQESDYRTFYRHLYPFEEEPLFWLHLNVDYPFHLKGILYFPALHKDFDFSKQSVKLYCNRVFVSDQCKDILPDYLTMLRGVIDSPDIPLNVSRSSLQMDKTVRQLTGHISKKVADSLSTLFKTDRPKYETSWRDIAPIVKLGVMQDDKFCERMKEILLWPSLQGSMYTLEEYHARNSAKIGDKVLYAFGEKQAVGVQNLYKAKEIDILLADVRLDPILFSRLEQKEKSRFQRVDAEVGQELVDASKEHTILDAEGKTQAGRLEDFYRKKLDGEAVEVQAKSLASSDVPALVIMDEQQRRFRDYLMTMRQEPAPLTGKQTLVLNSNHPLVTLLPALEAKDSALAKELAHELLDLALLSQKEMDPARLQLFVERTTQVLARLATLAI